jgi:ABC-type polysaccharide/polyol phosphate transport system ATPase subunit
MKSVPARRASAPAGVDGEPVIQAESVSKRYPGRPVLIFPPVLSIFERDLILSRRKRSSTPADAGARPSARDDYDLDDDDDVDDDEHYSGLDDEVSVPRARPDEMFWALKDVSLSVLPGAALGILGGPGAGKSTLLRILCGRAFPTEGRVLVRGRAAPLPAEVQKALGVSGKHGDDLAQACRLLGMQPHLIKQHRDDIEEMAQPLLTPDGDPARGARMRLAIATSLILPANVILLEEPRGLDAAFMERVFERLRERLRAGTALVLASQRPGFVRELCHEVIALHEGSIIARGDPTNAAEVYEASPNGGPAAKGKRGQTGIAVSEGERLLRGRGLRVPSVVAGFNASAALLAGEVRTATGIRSKRLDASEELLVEIRLETAARDTEVQCGVCFMPRTGETGVRLQLPEPLLLAYPRTYVLTCRIPPGTLRAGGYEVRADAIVAGSADHEASVIARPIGRLRIEDGELSGSDGSAPTVTLWDGRAAWLLETEWAVQ